MKIGISIVLSILFITSGCASTNSNSTAKTVNEEGKICTTEKVLGTRINKRVCRTEAQMEAEKLAAQTAAAKMQRRGGRSQSNKM